MTTPDLNQLGNLAMWADWQEKVRAALPNFAANPIYVEQNSPSEEEFERWANWIYGDEIDLGGTRRDEEFGARIVHTKSQGPITRMWLDSNVEMKFLRKHLSLSSLRALDIGAGYGRLAASAHQLFKSYDCVDAVPVSTEISCQYLDRFAPSVGVLSLDDFKETFRALRFDIAINVHSFNECSLPCIEAWLDCLGVMKTKYLFTVSHGQLRGTHESAYRSYGNGDPSFRPALEARYELVAEESLGLGNHPHALWRLK